MWAGFFPPFLLGCGIVFYLVGLPVWQLLVLFRAEAPLPMFIGEVLSVFRWEPVACIC